MSIFSGGSADDAGRWTSEWSSSVSAAAERSRALADQVAQLTCTASSSDGSVQVTVAATGAITDLRLSEQVRTRAGEELATQILAVMRRAQAQLAPRVAELADATVGPGSGTARAVVAGYERRFPAQPQEPEPGGAASAPGRGQGQGEGRARARGRGPASWPGEGTGRGTW